MIPPVLLQIHQVLLHTAGAVKLALKIPFARSSLYLIDTALYLQNSKAFLCIIHTGQVKRLTIAIALQIKFKLVQSRLKFLLGIFYCRIELFHLGMAPKLAIGLSQAHNNYTKTLLKS